MWVHQLVCRPDGDFGDAGDGGNLRGRSLQLTATQLGDDVNTGGGDGGVGFAVEDVVVDLLGELVGGVDDFAGEVELGAEARDKIVGGADERGLGGGDGQLDLLDGRANHLARHAGERAHLLVRARGAEVAARDEYRGGHDLPRLLLPQRPRPRPVHAQRQVVLVTLEQFLRAFRRRAERQPLAQPVDFPDDRDHQLVRRARRVALMRAVQCGTHAVPALPSRPDVRPVITLQQRVRGAAHAVRVVALLLCERAPFGSQVQQPLG